jgi:hypothetical protein
MSPLQNPERRYGTEPITKFTLDGRGNLLVSAIDNTYPKKRSLLSF